MRCGGHTTFYRGTWIRVRLRDGERIEGRFWERLSKYIVLKMADGTMRRIRTNQLEVSSIIKGAAKR